MKHILIHSDEPINRIKPLNGVGGGPVTNNFSYDATEEFRSAGIPFGRTHDIEYPLGAGEYVDIHNVFPDFEKDPDDPKAYNFVFTDEYLKNMLKAGTKPFYRLGTTIEHQPIKRYTYPPKSYEKWARICSHIISHYNEGWANGFEMGIEYWEIWNEPDIPTCWTGAYEEYYKLYDAAATLLKKEHPYIKIGGPTVTSPYSVLAEPFFAHIKESGAPLDFFSWHGYCHDPKEAKAMADRASELLTKYGFDKAESVYDEWNYVCDWDERMPLSTALHKTAFGTAFASAVLSTIQDTRTDISILYDAQMVLEGYWNNFFSPGKFTEHGKIRGVVCEKPYYALKAWGELKRAGEQVKVDTDEPNLYITAAKGEKELKVLVTLFNDDAGLNSCPPKDLDVCFDIEGDPYTSVTAFLTDNDRTFEKVVLDKPILSLKGNETTALLVFQLK